MIFIVKRLIDNTKRALKIGETAEPDIPGELLVQAINFADVAIINICRFSEEAHDRKCEHNDGDFYLTLAEQEMVKKVIDNFSKVVVLNVGGMVDTTWFKDNDKIQAVLLAWQAGMEGGLAEADILCGDVCPSGKLTDTFASCFDDYTSSYNFNESEDYAEYTEDIFVGYRYFETIPGVSDKVNYPFGFGLSYTKFDLKCIGIEKFNNEIKIKVIVENTDNIAGKEVVQVYYSAPQGVLGKSAKVLCAFCKTRELLPGETQICTLNFCVSDMASYDDTGKIQKAAYILESSKRI